MNRKRFTHASVFSGIGGPEVAAAMLGWQNLFHCEINEFGRRWTSGAKASHSMGVADVVTTMAKSQDAVAGQTSRLSPLFTEEMMGFPLMWTALPFLSESGEPKPSKPTATPSVRR